MDIVERRFENFKKFLSNFDCISFQYTMLLEQCSLQTFMVGLKEEYYNKNLTIDQMIFAIANKADINLKTVKFEDVEKFRKYIKYFLNVLEQLLELNKI